MESIQRSAHESALKTPSNSEALREFHYRRCDHVTDHEFIEEDEPVVVLHIAAPSAITDQEQCLDTGDLVEDRTETSLLGEVNRSYRFNQGSRSALATIQGSGDSISTSHTVHDIGIVESVSTGLFGKKAPDDPKFLRTETLEKSLTKSVSDTVRIFEEQDVSSSAHVTASYLNVEGVGMTRAGRIPHGASIAEPKIDTTIAEVHGQQHPRYELDPVIRPVWAGAQLTSSDYIDEDGEWTIDLD